MSNHQIIQREGYGAGFNRLTVSIDNTTLTKESINDYGSEKIKKEIKFYKYIVENNIQFPIPTIYSFGENSYTMNYLSDYIPLYKVFPNFSEEKKKSILQKIYFHLNSLHSFTQKTITREKYTTLLLSETQTKIFNRFQDIKHIINEYTFIKKVNGIVLKGFDECMEIIRKRVEKYIESLNEYNLCIIHGDCQFNNVMYNGGEGIVFIDPRGYFGDEEIYGIEEYDYAKICFALTGYDSFDSMKIDILDIEGDSLYLPNLFTIDNPFISKNTLILPLTLSIWLGNAHSFIKQGQSKKGMFSYFYGLYLCSVLL
jgi:hypothetical protein